MAEPDSRHQLGRIVAKAWQNDDFKRALIADPLAVLEREGVTVPAGIDIRVLEDSEQIVHLVLPPQLGRGIPDATLAAIVGGWSYGWSGDWSKR